MSKTLKTTAAMLLVITAVAMAQKPKLAFIVDADEKLGAGAYKQFSGQLAEHLEPKYAAVDRSAQALAAIRNEHGYQRGGEVREEKIKEMGRQFEVDFLCIISITWSISDYYLEAKLINVESARYKTATANSQLNGSSELTEAAKSIADKLNKLADSRSVGGSGEQAGSMPYGSKTYKTVKMPDGKIWFAENMNEVAGKNSCYQNSDANCQKCGRLYDWATAKIICPSGWHLPSDAEWTALENAVGGSSTAGMALKSKSGWDSNGNGMDKHGFSALACSYRRSDGSFFGANGSNANFWSATENGSGYAWSRSLVAHNSNTYRADYTKSVQLYVRCVKD